MASETCLGCNASAAVHDRRLISGAQSIEVHAAWKEILALSVKGDERLSANAERVEAAAACSGHLCRKCFSLLDRYQKAKHSLLINMKSVISSYDQHTILIGSKSGTARDYDDESVPTSKAFKPSETIPRRQLNFSNSQVDYRSPSVVVGIHQSY